MCVIIFSRRKKFMGVGTFDGGLAFVLIIGRASSDGKGRRESPPLYFGSQIGTGTGIRIRDLDRGCSWSYCDEMTDII